MFGNYVDSFLTHKDSDGGCSTLMGVISFISSGTPFLRKSAQGEIETHIELHFSLQADAI